MHADPNRISLIATWWMIAGEWRTHPARVVVAMLAIAVGVALGFAVHLINASALDEFARAIRAVSGEADLQVHAVSPLGFDEALYPRLARLDGISDASPVVELSARVNNNRDASLRILGLDFLRAASVTPSLIGRRTVNADASAGSGLTDAAEAATGSDMLDEGALYLSEAALAATGTQVGEVVELGSGGWGAQFVIAGDLPGVADDQEIGVIDIATAQWRFGQLGRLQRIDLRLVEGASGALVRNRLDAILPPDAELVSAESEARRSDNLSRAYRVNLDMLALVALLSGSFLVFAAQSLSVTRRRAQFALLRVLGVRRRGIVTQLVLEGAIVGSIGAVAGLALGLGLADAALSLFGGDLGGGYFRGAQPELVLAPRAAVVFLLLGIGVAMIGSLLPARAAAQASPAIALKNAGDVVDPKALPLTRTSLALLLLGIAAAFLPAIGDLPVFGYLSIALILAGGIAAMPSLARLILTPLQRFGSIGVAVDLALKRLWGAPSQAAIALCGIVASTGLMVAMAVMVWSFRGSVDEWLVEVLPADIYFYVQGDGGAGMDPELQRRLATTPGVATIGFVKRTPLRLSPERPPVMLIAEDINPADPGQRLPLIGRSLAVPDGAIPVWLSQAGSMLYGARPGDWMTLPIVPASIVSGAMVSTIRGGAGEAGTQVFVAGLWRDYARQHGAIAMDSADYTSLTQDELRGEGSVVLAAGATTATVIESLRASLPNSLAGRVAFEDPGIIRTRALQIFDRSFAVTYLLELIAVLVGLSGVAATFSAQTLARTKEFGMLRHIGVSRRQIMAMLSFEGAFLGAIGVVAGAGLGLVISQVLIHVVNPQSFHWTMETRLPHGLFLFIAIALIGSCAATALVSGRRALSADAVRAVQEDW